MTTLRRVSVFVLCLVFLAVPAMGAEKGEGQWQLAGFTKYRDGLFVDMSRLSFPSPESVKAWVKIAPWAKSVYQREINTYLSSIGKGNQGFKAIEILCEFDCAKSQVRFLNFVYFSQDKRVIHTADEGQSVWMYIPPGNLWGNVADLVCKGRK